MAKRHQSLKKDIFQYIAAVIVAIAVFGSCAKMAGTLGGGPKDIAPPKFTHSAPPNYSTNFSAKRVDLYFDEFLQLKDVNTQFYSSPPIEKSPEILLYNKDVRINLREPLMPNTTYTFNFGTAISDLNEGNIAQNFMYVLSTGDYVDSLTLTGRVLNAFNLKTSDKEEKTPISIMFYDDLNDSVVYKQKPKYITRADAHGFFTLPNVNPGTFLLFVIRDIGNNLKFDGTTEMIAFSDSLIVMDQRYYLDPEGPIFTSTTVPDSLKEKNPEIISSDIKLFLFQEVPSKQRRISYERKSANTLNFIYAMPLAEPLGIKIKDYEPSEKWYELEKTRNNDTITYWLLDTTLVNRKDLLVELNSPRTDSLNQLVYKVDTLRMSFETPPQPTANSGGGGRLRLGRGNNAPKEKPKTDMELMKLETNIKTGGKMDLIGRTYVMASQPIDHIDLERIILSEMVDTVPKKIAYTLARDSLNARKCYIDWTLKEDTRYILTIDTMAFTSAYGAHNDSIGFNFSSQRKDYYSSISVTFENVTSPLVVQAITGDAEIVVKQTIVPQGNTASIEYLPPDKYRIKIIHDRNGNGKWDTGNYLKKIQPERVEYYSEEIQTRSNWKTELQIPLKN